MYTMYEVYRKIFSSFKQHKFLNQLNLDRITTQFSKGLCMTIFIFEAIIVCIVHTHTMIHSLNIFKVSVVADQLILLKHKEPCVKQSLFNFTSLMFRSIKIDLMTQCLIAMGILKNMFFTNFIHLFIFFYIVAIIHKQGQVWPVR